MRFPLPCPRINGSNASPHTALEKKLSHTPRRIDGFSANVCGHALLVMHRLHMQLWSHWPKLYTPARSHVGDAGARRR